MDYIEQQPSENNRDDRKPLPGETREEYHQRRQRERRIVYKSWKEVPKGLKTKGQWAELDRRPLKHAQSKVFVLINPLYKHSTAKLYTIDQTEPYTPTPLERAMRHYYRLFLKYAAKDDFIWLGVNKDTGKEGWNRCRPRAATLEKPGLRFSPVNKDKARQHVLGKQVYGVVGNEYTFFLALDADLHLGKNEDGSKKYGDPDIFMKQIAVLVHAFHGRHACHFQVKDQDAAGLHVILVPDPNKKMKLEAAVKNLRGLLVRLDQKHPELADAARKAGMKTFAQMEIYPDRSNGFRLPLCRERTMLLDRPLPLVYNRRLKDKVQDVEGYVAWLLDPQRRDMPAANVMAFLEERLVRHGPALPATVALPPTQKDGKTSTSKRRRSTSKRQRRKTLLKSRTADAIARLFKGQPDADTPWRDLLPVLLRLLWASGVDQERAVDTVIRKLDAIPDKSFSRALDEGNYDDIENKLRSQAKKIWQDNDGQADPALSVEKLRNSVKKWQAEGIDVANLAGFKTKEEYGAPLALPPVTCAGSFQWQADEMDDVAALSDILKCTWETAGNVLLTLVKHVATGPKPVAPAFLMDLLKALPVKLRRRNKQSAAAGLHERLLLLASPQQTKPGGETGCDLRPGPAWTGSAETPYFLNTPPTHTPHYFIAYHFRFAAGAATDLGCISHGTVHEGWRSVATWPVAANARLLSSTTLYAKNKNNLHIYDRRDI